MLFNGGRSLRWRPIVAGLRVCGLTLALALHSLGQASPSPQTITPSHTPEKADDQTTAIPRFYSQSRQVIVEAIVWDKRWDKSKYWIGDEPIGNRTKFYLRQHLYPPSRGLKPKDFRVLEDGAEQRVNYFKEADFPAVDVTDHWVFWPSAHGTWGVLEDQCTRARAIGCSVFDSPSATYLIGYTPPPMHPGECRTINVLVKSHDVQLNRQRYCALSGGGIDLDSIAGPKLAAKMRDFAKSSARGLIDVSVQTPAFWGSGVLSLLREASPNGSVPTIGTDFTYVVEVHDSQAPATVHIAASLKFPNYHWSYPCSTNSAAFISGVAYDAAGEIAAQFADRFDCIAPTVTGGAKFFPLAGGIQLPDRFDTQISLRPGDYDLRVVASDGEYFGRARMPLHVEPLTPEHLMVSDVVIAGVVRYGGWVLREATDVSPAPVVPNPLVSKDSQYYPDSDQPPRLHKHTPLYIYFEIYEPQVETDGTSVYFQWRITDEKTGATVMSTDRQSAADWVVPGNEVIPIGLKLDTEKLNKGSYDLEVQASDSAGHQSEWRAAKFDVH